MSLETASEPRKVRHAFVDISPEMLLRVLQVKVEGTRIDNGIVRCTQDRIPSDAEAKRCGITENGSIRLVLSRVEFQPTIEGEILPKLNPIYSWEPLPEPAVT